MRTLVLVNNKNVGDDNNARGTADAFSGIAGGLDAENSQREVVVVQDGALEAVIGEILTSPDERFVIFAAGEHMLEHIRAITGGLTGEARERVTISWSSHQIPSGGIDDVYALVDHVVLPDHVKLPDHEKLIKTVGVPHNTTAESLAAQELGGIPEADKYMFVVLGGDAPGGDKYNLYPPEEARKLGEMVGREALKGGYQIIATNGPRTGMIDPGTGERREDVHKEGNALDPVSQAFLDEVNETGATEMHFSDFVYGIPSEYRAMLAATVRTPGSVGIMPGESTSMVTEGGDLLPRGACLVYRNGAMNPTHEAHMKSAANAGLAVMVEDFGDALPAIVVGGDAPSHKPAAVVTAETVFWDLNRAVFGLDVRESTVVVAVGQQ